MMETVSTSETSVYLRFQVLPATSMKMTVHHQGPDDGDSTSETSVYLRF
jgi:hypothetical protein